MVYSYTQINQYLRCPRSYRYRYLDGWREKETRAGLLFGRALDVDAVHRGDRQVDRELDRVVRPRETLGSLHLFGELAESFLNLVRVAEETAETTGLNATIVAAAP